MAPIGTCNHTFSDINFVDDTRADSVGYADG